MSAKCVLFLALLAAVYAETENNCKAENPCATGWGGSAAACPSACPGKSPSYGDCCHSDKCGTKEQCESVDATSVVLFALLVICCCGVCGWWAMQMVKKSGGAGGTVSENAPLVSGW